MSAVVAVAVEVYAVVVVAIVGLAFPIGGRGSGGSSGAKLRGVIVVVDWGQVWRPKGKIPKAHNVRGRVLWVSFFNHFGIRALYSDTKLPEKCDLLTR